ncbi:MAG TPA: hypothetical protein H9871_12060, partial [Candidatus Nesterenkonia stercoripullorum]|nr:hypothetical protein [Candidatus Nesterenkonia stercoripullorum]
MSLVSPRARPILVEAGRTGLETALVHHTAPWSNGYSFGSDRHHRSCEMAREAVQDHVQWNSLERIDHTDWKSTSAPEQLG